MKKLNSPTAEALKIFLLEMSSSRALPILQTEESSSTSESLPPTRLPCPDNKRPSRKRRGSSLPGAPTPDSPLLQTSQRKEAKNAPHLGALSDKSELGGQL
ncbi:hypothetical protein AVEN_214955-1 [Araneus ventricosus]|uniref:Uncharacterized protein n=1 Tax=Araneus ventricosus TaxID=182803 RepID=A0A4Y2DAJ4_ARAVE|nr:hypothetical protein AVEN_214955-1 [Araneus ventricosus]